MHRALCLFVFALLCSCQGFDFEVRKPRTGTPDPQPPGETSPHPTGPYAHLPQRQSFRTMSSIDLKEGCYCGDFVLGRVQLRVNGVGAGKTVIHGNLVLQTQCEVSNLTVTGDVIFEGSQARLRDVDFFGRVVDRGMQNSY